MTTPLVLCLLTAIGVSLCWLWAIRRLFAITNERLEDERLRIEELNRDLNAARTQLKVQRGLAEVARYARRRRAIEDAGEWRVE